MRYLCCACLVAAVLSLGCGGKGTIAPVSGRVTLDDRPLADADISFLPDDSDFKGEMVRGSAAKTDADGKFTLHIVGIDSWGAAVGRHRVIVTKKEGPNPRIPVDGGMPVDTRKEVVPSRYHSPTTLSFEVPRGGTSAADFALTAP